ncbi:elongation factor Tu [Streptomyces xanthophaeus]
MGAQEKFGRSRPHLNIATIGHADHGKTTLTAALTRVCAEGSGKTMVGFDTIDAAPKEVVNSVSLRKAYVEYGSNIRHYTHTDAPAADIAKNLVAGAGYAADGAVLVVSAPKGLEPMTREHIRLARQVGIRYIVVFLNKADLVQDAKQLDLVESEVRGLLSTYGYLGDDTPVITGSARLALEGKDDKQLGTSAVKKLVETLDSYVPVPERAVDQPFLMPIEDVLTIAGRGTLVTGRIDRGKVRPQDALELVGLRDTTTTACISVEMFGKTHDEGQAGDNCGVALRGTKRDDIEGGQVLVKPGSVKAHTKFTAEVYILSTEEGGRTTPISKGYRPLIHLRTTPVTGSVDLPDGIEKVHPGDIAQLEITLACSIAMEDGMRFNIREGKKTVGAGIVTNIIE